MSGRVRRGFNLAAVAVLASAAPSPQGEPATLSCEVVVPPSDSGSGRIQQVAPGGDRLLAWTDGRPGQVLVRDASGETRIVGRRGAGPGEFARISQLGWIGDTLWVHDASNSRIQYFAADGAYLGGTRLPPRATYAPRPGGRFVGFAGRPLARLDLPIVWLGARANATVADTLATFESVLGDPVMVPAGTREVRNPHPLMASTIHHVSPDHNRACAAIPAGANQTTLRCVDDRGQLTLERRLAFAPRPTTDAIYDSVIARFSRAPGRTPAMMRDRISRPRTLPQVSDLRISTDGQIWVQRSHAMEREAFWTRLRADGSVRDDVRVPALMRVLVVDGERVWAAIAEEDGLETLGACRVAVARR